MKTRKSENLASSSNLCYNYPRHVYGAAAPHETGFSRKMPYDKEYRELMAREIHHSLCGIYWKHVLSVLMWYER